MATTCQIDGQIFFTDLPTCIVGGLQSASGPGGGWFPFKYTLDRFAGVGLSTGAHSPAGELVLDLGLTGWHRLHVAHTPAVRMWLDGETGYCEVPGISYEVRDVAFPAADFTGKKLHIAPVRGAEVNKELILFFLRAEPCEPPVSRRNLIVTDDGHGDFWQGMDGPRDLYRHLYPFKDSDVFRMVWGVYGGGPLTLRADTKVAESPIRPEEQLFYEGEYRFCRSLQRFVDAGVDPLAVVRQATREYGMELHFYNRMSAFYGPFPHVGWNTQFFLAHPEWRCRDEFGQTLNFMSYAYPQVQDYVLAYFDELLDYDPEGLCLAFNRGLPLMICEEPVVEAYRRKYGREPKLPEEVDTPELQAVKAELLADFVARVQALAAKRGKVVSCIVPRDLEHNRLFGLDAELLIRRGLVESVMVGAGHGDAGELNDDITPVQALKALGRQAGVKVYAGGSQAVHGKAWVGDLKTRAQRMAGILDAGLDGGWFWDAENIFNQNWEALRRFGDRATLDRIIRGEWPNNPEYDTLSIHDLQVTRYNPWHAY
ncbi:MAG: glycoside hydrolase family 10 protein [Armatimonadota bacterium]